MRATSRFFFWLLAVGIVCSLIARPAEADLWTASGSGSDGALSAEANFTIVNGQIQVTITNLLNPATIISIGQAVSDLSFTISNGPGTNSSNTSAGQLVTVNSNGSVTDVSGNPDRWISSSTGGFKIAGDTILLEAIGHGSPTELILPSDGGKGYAKSNASITGHSPSVDGPATFTLNLTGVTSSTTISAVQFSFGTGPDTDIHGTQSISTPEPSTLVIAGLGALGFLGYGLRKRMRA
jgi:hypothetical protein